VENKTLPILEIVTKGEFFDYLGKYQKNMVEEICPAELTVQETNRLQSLTLAVHKALKLGKYSRIDFILGEDGEFYCLEANTLPGMTPTSLIPIEAKASGIGYKEFCQHLIDISLK